MNSYASSYRFGHKAIDGLWQVPLYIEEKVDGSQFSFASIDGELRCRSRGADLYVEAPDSLFRGAVEYAKQLHDGGKLVPGWVYRGEVLKSPKHNSLAYDRVPRHNIILFDVNDGDGSSVPRAAFATNTTTLESIAADLDLEVVPLLGIVLPSDYSGLGQLGDKLRYMVENTTSVLGGQKIEGVVIKQCTPTLYGTDKKVLMCKYVGEAFKEVHRKAWGEGNPSISDKIERIAKEFCTPARWNKAIQHREEAGKLTNSLQDIGPLVKDIPQDTENECKEEIKDRLWELFWPDIRRMVTRGFVDYYKERINLQMTRETNGQAVENEVG